MQVHRAGLITALSSTVRMRLSTASGTTPVTVGVLIVSGTSVTAKSATVAPLASASKVMATALRPEGLEPSGSLGCAGSTEQFVGDDERMLRQGLGAQPVPLPMNVPVSGGQAPSNACV